MSPQPTGNAAKMVGVSVESVQQNKRLAVPTFQVVPVDPALRLASADQSGASPFNPLKKAAQGERPEVPEKEGKQEKESGHHDRNSPRLPIAANMTKAYLNSC